MSEDTSSVFYSEARLKLGCFPMTTWRKLVIVLQHFNSIFQQHSLCHGELHFIDTFDNLTDSLSLEYRSYSIIDAARRRKLYCSISSHASNAVLSCEMFSISDKLYCQLKFKNI